MVCSVLIPGCRAANLTNANLRPADPSWYAIDALNADETKGRSIFSKFANAKASYVRDTNCWAYALDLTPLSAWNSHPDNNGDNYAKWGQCLISPLHYVTATHVSVSNGTTIRWVTRSNTVEARTVVKRYNVGADMTVGLLSAPITNCGFARFLDSNWTNILCKSLEKSGVARFASVPVFSLNQNKFAFIHQVNGVVGSNLSFGFGPYMGGTGVSSAHPTQTSRRARYPGIVSGDSGHPLCLVLTNQLVLLSHYYGAGFGPNYAANRAAIDAAMISLGGGYQTTAIPWPSTNIPDLYPSDQ